jgi:AcrR family transcriptional regulator
MSRVFRRKSVGFRRSVGIYGGSRTAQKQEPILDESIRLFRERRFAGVSVSEVMKAAGLTRSAFYNHLLPEDLMAETLIRELQCATIDFDKLPAMEKCYRNMSTSLVKRIGTTAAEGAR